MADPLVKPSTAIELKERTLQSKLRYWADLGKAGMYAGPAEAMREAAAALDAAEARARELEAWKHSRQTQDSAAEFAAQAAIDAALAKVRELEETRQQWFRRAKDAEGMVADAQREQSLLRRQLDDARSEVARLAPLVADGSAALDKLRAAARKLLQLGESSAPAPEYYDALQALEDLLPEPFDPERSPGHTDLMIEPEAIDEALAATPGEKP